MDHHLATIVLFAVASTLLLISWIFAIVVRFVCKTYRLHHLVKKLPQGPKPLPLVGNALSLLGGFDRVLELMHVKWPSDYGEIYCSYLGFEVNVSISSPELLEPILKSQKILDKGNIYNFFRQWLGDGLVLSTGGKWKARRRLLTPAFHFQILETFLKVFNKQSQVLCEIVEKRLETQEGIAEVDIYPLVSNCSLDIICETAMGVSVNAQSRTSDYVRAVHRINQIIVHRFVKPWLANRFIFPFTTAGREYRELLHTLHTFTQNVIKHRRETFCKTRASNRNDREAEANTIPGYRRRQALLDILLQAESDATDGVSLSDSDIQEEIDTFMFEGHDTTASAMSWFLYCMASNPKHQEFLYEELSSVFSDSDRSCSKQDLDELIYLDRCVKEALRMYPSAPHIERRVTEDIQLGSYTIPAGCNIIMLLYGILHNPRLFPDPWVFDPDRFLPDRARNLNPYAYIPFSAGPRNCIGQRFALMEVKVVASTFLRHFRVSLSPSTVKPIPSMQAILKPMCGIRMIVTSRK